MNGTSTILQEEYSDLQVIQEKEFLHNSGESLALNYTDLELLVTDALTGKPIPKAMISIDSRSRTAVCNDSGMALLKEILSGVIMLDVIVWGYSAKSTNVSLSAMEANTLHIEMERIC